MNIPLLNNVLKRTNDTRSSNPTPINDIITKKNAQYIREHPDLLEIFSEISKELIKMGFSPKLINNLFLVKHFQTLEEAIDLLSKTENQWNHDYLEGDNFICFICDSAQTEHKSHKNIFHSQQIDPKIIQKLNSFAERVSLNKEKDQFVIKINLQDCPICFAEISEDNKYYLKCKHLFCKECIVNYLEEEINNARVLGLKCAWKDCNEIIQDEEIKSLVTEKTFKKLKKFRLRKEIQKDPSTQLCPIADCEGFAKKSINNLEEEKNSSLERKSLLQVKYSCSNNHNFCGKCNRVWHGSNSCEDDKEILDFATDSGKMLKKCPKCKVWTEKNEGCNHMHCKICEYDWCWICEMACPLDHFRIQNTPCYGKQFNEEGDPDFEYYDLLIDQSNFFKSLIFFFVFSFLVINSSIRNVLMQNRQNNHIQRPSKFIVFVILFCMFLFCFVFLILTNGIIVMYMFVNLGKLQTVRNNFCKFVCVTIFLILLLIFYPFGVTFACFWFVVCMLYSFVKLIQF